MKSYISKRYVLYVAVIAFIFVFTMTFFNKIYNTVEVFKANIEMQKIEKQGYKSYEVLDGSFRFSIPSSWNSWEQKFIGGEIIYNLNFMTPNKKIHGFIQVWQMEKPLAEFLEESKKAAVGAVEFKEYDEREITVNRKKGFLIRYSRAKDNEGYIKAYEAFLDGGNGRIYRASFFTDEEDWRRYYPLMFNRIIQSFNIK
ncbi:hypothetical protein [Lutispora thermophila]|uniref:PsbP protein n=1 Tax=Lutispora thermophila DSM 19022 TaxID=1122184 RepID=A0A1M6FUG9_9FIRM|nr:hypothetical protein [Lutispora thermophila]SHJ01345.1 hypothetical protein SAMN02745176_02103 [Lutispora thermophila DSM 19022]